MRPDVTSAEEAINLTSIVSVVVLCCVNVEAASSNSQYTSIKNRIA